MASGSRTHKNQQHQAHPRGQGAIARVRSSICRAPSLRRNRRLWPVLNEEMEEVFGPTPEGLTERVRERRSTHSQLAERRTRIVFADSPSDPSSWPKRNDVEVEPLAAGDSVQGLPGCPGVSEGVARVVLDSSDPCTRARRCSCCAEY